MCCQSVFGLGLELRHSFILKFKTRDMAQLPVCARKGNAQKPKDLQPLCSQTFRFRGMTQLQNSEQSSVARVHIDAASALL